MKFITVFVALLSVAFGYQASWTLHELSQAIQNPATDPTLLPYLEQALNQMMNSIFAGEQVSAVTVTIPAVDLSTWTLAELSAAMQNPTTDPALLPYLAQALNQMMDSIVAGHPLEVVPVVVPAMDVSSWTLPELNAALENPNTNPALIPYLEHALNEIMHALMTGEQMESIVIAVPAGLLPVENPVSPVVPVAPIEAPVIPVEAPVAPDSPLVQIIVNVNAQGTPVAPTPVANPEESKPEPVIIVDQAAPQPIVPPASINPIDVVAITPPLINPVDILYPIGVVSPVAAGGDVVGPIV